ncbi:MAG: tetratricopeptide repeat protein [Armatimonadota bacterium]
MNIEPSLSIQERTRQTAELQALLRMLSLSSGSFSLSISVCNSPALRDYLIEQTMLVHSDINVVNVPNGTTDIFPYVKKDADEVGCSALYITGIENSLTSSDLPHPLLQSLNVSRELWERYYHCPVVIWLPEYAAGLMSLEAPDFWRYRSHRFEFVSESAHFTSELLEDAFENVNSASDLSVDERQFRIAELEQRLEEAGPTIDTGLRQYVLMWLNELAYLYRVNGQRHDEEQTISRLRTIYGDSEDSDDIAHSMLLLGDLYAEWGQYESAERMYGASKEISERLLTADPAVLARLIDISNCEDKLGGVFQVKGAYDDAERLYRQALMTRERYLGSEHPYTLLSVIKLAGLRLAKGDVAGAESEFEHTLSLCERELGADDHLTLMAANNLAYLFSRHGNITEAEPLFRRVLVAHERLHGPEHRHTLVSANNLAALLNTKGDFAGAEPLLRRVLDARERTIGADHPDTLVSLNNLAYLLKNKGDLAGAEALYRRALATREQIWGSDHPDTLNSMNNLAILLMTKGNIDAAEQHIRYVLSARNRILGPEHPDTLTSEVELAGLLLIQGDFDSAERLYHLVLETQERVLGANHPDTMATMSNLAFLLDKKKELANPGLSHNTIQRAGEPTTEYDISDPANQ